MRQAVLLVQKEYADRLAAPAGGPAYGSLTLFARYYAVLEPLLTVRPQAFWPRPEVDSMLVRFLHARAAAGGRGRRGAAVPHHPRIVPDEAQASS